MTSAFLYNTNLNGADMTGISLVEAYLYETDFTGVDLSGANLRDSTFGDFSGATLSKTTICPNGGCSNGIRCSSRTSPC